MSEIPFEDILDLEKMKRYLTNRAAPIKDVIKLPKETIEQMHSRACYLYEIRNFSEASIFFLALANLHPTYCSYILGVAKCYWEMELYKSALSAFSVLEAIEGDNPIYSYHAAECYIKLRQFKSAFEELLLARKKCKDSALKSVVQRAIELFSFPLFNYELVEICSAERENRDNALSKRFLENMAALFRLKLF